MQSKIFVTFALVIGVALTGCGGGGSSNTSDGGGMTSGNTGSGTNSVGSTGTGTETGTSTIVTSVPPATYTANGDNAIIYAQMNTIRLAIGSGLLAENVDLDKSATAHLNYLALNGIADPSFHVETSGQAGFTGVNPSDRMTAAGYNYSTTGETGYSALVASAAVTGCVNGWADSVYHVEALLVGYRDVGVAAGDNALASSPSITVSTCVVDLGVQANAQPQYPASGVLLAYPYSDQTGVATSFNNQSEIPTPVPDLTGVGQPITVNLSAAVNSISVFTLTAAGGIVVPTRILAPAGTSGLGVVIDGNINANFATLVPTSALSPNTTYTVKFNGVANGTTMSGSWSFTTGAAGYTTTNI
jgi:uncharacterized protein YkwD